MLVSATGATYRRVLDEEGLDQPELERVAALLNERVRGRTLREVRDALAREARVLRRRADRMLARAIELGSRALATDEQTGADLRVAPINDQGEVELEAMFGLIDDKTLLVGVAHVANALGTICPLDKIIPHAQSRGVPVLVDGAQGVPHLAVDVKALGCDFYVFSGHKMFGPTGTGILWGREELLEAMPPWQGGGDMILEVSFDKTVYNELPYKFEAGTPNISGFAGLGATIDYQQQDRKVIPFNRRVQFAN